MPSLAELENEAEINDFISVVVEQSNNAYQRELSLNDGICTSEDLTALHQAGDNIPFNYDRLINEAGTYD